MGENRGGCLFPTRRGPYGGCGDIDLEYMEEKNKNRLGGQLYWQRTEIEFLLRAFKASSRWGRYGPGDNFWRKGARKDDLFDSNGEREK